jgi:DNA-binding GntR family transcriptional regulator
MTEIDPIGNPEYAYLQVADDLAARITAGEFPVRLPSERALAAGYQVACQTVRHAVAVLRERGMIVTRHGRGSFVRPPAPPG